MARSDKDPVSRTVAWTKAHAYGTVKEQPVTSVKSGGYKVGQDRFEPSKRSSDVSVLYRTGG